MPYTVRHKVTGEERVLQESQVNDMESNEQGQIIVFDTDLEPHYLIEDGQIVNAVDVCE